MKQLLKIIFYTAVFPSFLAGCNKNAGQAGNTSKPLLSLSATTPKRGEPIIASTTTSGNDQFVRWTINPSGRSLVSGGLNATSILFTEAGTYSITANYYPDSVSSIPIDSISSPVVVTDTLFNPPALSDGTDTTSLTGDQLRIQPQYVSDSGIVLLVQTEKLYKCYPMFIGYGSSLLNGSLQADFNYIRISQSDNCGGIQNHAIAAVFYPAMPDGTYPINIEFNRIHYAGSVNVIGKTYRFTWPYASGVTISPLQLNQQ